MFSFPQNEDYGKKRTKKNPQNFILYGLIEQVLRVRDKQVKLQREKDDEFSGRWSSDY